MAIFSPLLEVLAEIPDPRRAEGKLYQLPYVLLFAILAIVSGCNSYRGIITFIDVHRHRLNAIFALKWRRAPAHTAIRYILQGLDPAAVEAVFRRHAALLQAARATPAQGRIAFAFYNIGVILWVVLTFSPLGWPQLEAVYEHGLAYALSQAFYDTTLFWQWTRIVGISFSRSGHSSWRGTFSFASARSSPRRPRLPCHARRLPSEGSLK